MRNSILIINLLLPFILIAENTYLGIRGAHFLKIGLSARAEGMGASFVALTNGGIDAINYNPASLNSIKKINIIFSYIDWIDNVSINYLAFAKPYPKWKGIVSSSFTFLYISPVIYYNDWGEEIGRITFYNIAVTGGYARTIKRKYKLGGNIKVLLQKIADKSELGFGIDMGFLYTFKPFPVYISKKYILNFRDLTAGVAIRNLGTKAGSETLPLSIDFGASTTVIDGLRFIITFVKPIYELASFVNLDYKVNFGFEYNFQNIFYLRTGYKLNYNIPNNFTIGFGVRTKFLNGEIFVDYAYASYTYLEKTNRLTLKLRIKKWRFWQ